MQLPTPDRLFGTAMRNGWHRLLVAARPRYRLDRRWRRHRHACGASVPPPADAVATAIDPVALTILAVKRLGPATLRTVANGPPLSVTLPDARIGAIFRAALAEMQKTAVHRPAHRHRHRRRHA